VIPIRTVDSEEDISDTEQVAKVNDGQQGSIKMFTGAVLYKLNLIACLTHF